MLQQQIHFCVHSIKLLLHGRNLLLRLLGLFDLGLGCITESAEHKRHTMKSRSKHYKEHLIASRSHSSSQLGVDLGEEAILTTTKAARGDLTLVANKVMPR